MYTHLKTVIIAIIILLCGFSTQAKSKPKVYKKARIEWQAIQGASEYEIEIRKNGFVILKKRTTQNYVESNLDHGVYKFRLSVYDHKKDLANQTGWRTLIVKKWGLVSKKYQYVAVGWGYSTLIPEWHTILQNSNRSFQLYYAYDLPWTGYAVEALVEYEDFDPEEDNKTDSHMNIWSITPGMCLFAQMNQYFDVTMHINGGVALSNLDVVDNGTNQHYFSVDPISLFGLGIRGSYGYGFVEHGIQFKTIYYNGEILNEFRPFIRAGARF